MMSAMPDENKIHFLKKSRMFERASDEVVTGCEHLFVQKAIPAGTVLFEQGDVGRMVYLIKQGRVRIARRTSEGKEVTISILGQGDIFGEEVVFTQVRRTAVATALEDTLICMARANDLFGLFLRHPLLALNVAKYLREQLDDALCVTEDVAYLKVSDRLTHLLERLAAEHGRRVEDGILLDVRLTRAEIASLIGSTRETVSVRIASLARAGRLRLQGRSIVLLDPAP